MRDYSKLVGATGPIQYPAASLYLYAFFNVLKGDYEDFEEMKQFMTYVHMVGDMIRMWLIVRIYKKAFGKKYQGKLYVFALLLFQAKYKFVSVMHHFNDCWMIIIALAAIHLLQYGWSLLSAILMGIAINIKMSAILIVPGFLLVVAFSRGLVLSLITLAIMIAMQVAIGYEFLIVNKEAYISMSYNFDRRFVKIEQVNFQFLSEKFQHSDLFNKILLAGHVGFLLVFLLCKWTGPSTR